MKKLLLSFAMLLTIVGCGSDDGVTPDDNSNKPDTPPTEEPTPPAEEKTYLATIESASQFGFEWNDDSSISLFTTTQNEQFSYDTESEEFKKADTTTPAATATPSLFGIYPYAEDNQVNESGKVTFTTPLTQPYKADGIDFAVNPMLAIAELEATELEFKHLFGYLNIPIYALLPDDTQSFVIKQIKLSAATDTPVAGTASFETSEVSDGNYTFEFDSSKSSDIILDCGEGVSVGSTIENATSFHFILPAATYTDGYTIEITTNDGNIINNAILSEVTIERGQVTNLDAIEIALIKKSEYLLDVKFDAEGNATDAGMFNLNIVKNVNSSNEAPYLSAYTCTQFDLNNIARFNNYPYDVRNTHSYYSVDISNADLQAAMKDGFTVETVAMFPIDIATHWSRLISTESWGIMRQGAGFSNGAHPFLAYANAPGTNWSSWDKSTKLTHEFKANTYFHITYVYSPNHSTDNEHVVLIYVNGLYDSQIALNKELNPGSILTIGAYPYANGEDVFHPWCGDIALARIHDNILDAETIYERFNEIKFPESVTAPQRPTPMLDLQVNEEGLLTNKGSMNSIVPTLVKNNAGKTPSIRMLELDTYDKPILAFKHNTNASETVTDSYYKVTSSDSPEFFTKLNDGTYTIEAIISTPNALDRSVPVSTEAFNLMYMPEYNKYNIRTFNENREWLHYDSFYTPSTSKYLHIVYVADVANGQLATTFVNGRHDGTYNNSPISSLAPINNFTIGCAAASEDGQTPFCYGFDGNVVMVRVYDKALTPMEVNLIYTEDNIKDTLTALDKGIDINPEEPEVPEFPALTTLADIQWSNNGENKPVATDDAITIQTKYMDASVQNLWVSDAPEGYTLNKIAKWCTDETKMTYFIADMTNIRSKMQDGFSIEVIHRDPRTEGNGVVLENNWRALFGGRDFGLWLNKNWNGNNAHNAQYRGQYQWDARMWTSNTDETAPGTGVIAPNEWHHTVYIYDAANKKLQVYTDGELKVEKTNAVLRNTDQRLPIGARMFSSSDTTKFTWGGEMALFKIYDDAVTAEQIAAMYGNRQPQIAILSE
ncbi:MAG: hypothetical protein J6V27_01620 [Alistipes sp.]|nr:hypothetical protein [Alistipes sp.]